MSLSEPPCPADPQPVGLSCPHRVDVHLAEASEYARCRLLAEITGVGVAETPPVLRASCLACREQPRPSTQSLNGMVASRLYLFTKDIMERNGMPGCEASKAAPLHAWAQRNLAGMRTRDRPQKRSPPPVEGPCFYLGPQRGEVACTTCKGKVRLKTFFCLHDHHDETTIRHCETCDDYDLRLSQGSVRSWAVGITTAPRRRPTLEQTLQSVRQAGWHGQVHVFAEPDAPLPKNLSNLTIVRRAQPLGAWPNWLLGLTELHLSAPHADAYLMLQDDADFVRGLRSYLERTLWPSYRLGVVSLHTPRHQARENARGFFQSAGGWGAWGAMGLVFPNAAARSLLRDGHIVNHRSRGMGEGLKNIDSVVGDWCRRKALPFYLHAPSLCQHTGLTTTLWSRDSLEGRRSAADFPGEDVDITAWLDSHPQPAEPAGIAPDAAAGSLAVVGVHIGRRACFGSWKDWLFKSATPEASRLVLVDNSADAQFRSADLDPLAREVVEKHRFAQCQILTGPGPSTQAKRLSVERMESYAAALTLAFATTDEELILTVDDDTIPPADALEKLVDAYRRLQLAGHRVAAVSGCYESAAATGYLVASRSPHGWSDRPRVGELGTDALIEVGMVGNGCCLMQGAAVRALLPVSPRLPSGKVLGPDGYLCSRLREAGYSIWLHGGVRCQHLFRVKEAVLPSPPLPRIESPGLLADLGFHHGEGFHRLMMALGITPDWRIEVFEPNPACRRSLDIFSKHFPNARIHGEAVWTENGTISFWQENRRRSRSTASPVDPANAQDGEGSTVMPRSMHAGLEPAISVRCIDFPQWLRQAFEAKPGRGPVIVKMDIEGAEYPVLRKLLDDGTASRIDHLFVEFHHRFLPDEDAESTAILSQRLRGAGVTIYPWK